MTKQVYRVTLDKEKPIVEEIPANFVDQFVSNRDHTSKNIAKQKPSSVGRQDGLKVTSSDGTGLTGLTHFARNFGRDQCVTPRSKEMKNKSSFAELLYKYRKISKVKIIG